MASVSSDASAVLFLDRFTSATSADDARSSLEQILDGLTTNQIPVSAFINDLDFFESLLQLLHTGQHRQQSIPVEEGPTLVCRILLQVLSSQHQQKNRDGPSLLTLPSPGRLLEILLDVASTDSNNANLDDGIPMISTYTRVLALQLLMKLCQLHGSMAQAQLLQAPNGLHRLADLLDPSMEDQVRNEALLLAKVVSKWPSCAKIWIFAEMGDTLMRLALSEGGLTNGSVLVLDCLEILANLFKHEASSADLAWQSLVIAPSLTKLVDLREANNFKNPSTAAQATTSKTIQQQQHDDDDLDAILNSASSNKLTEEVDQTSHVPKLTDKEELVIFAVLDVLAVILGSETYRIQVWKQHLALCSLVWELALLTPPSMPFVCAVPSVGLQQKALETVSLFFADATTMDRLQGLDRLLFLVCTGNGGASPKEWKERCGLSQAALHVIRQTLPKEMAQEYVLFTLAPPMTEDLTGPPPLTVVQKLLNTVRENLQVEELGNDENRRVNLIGALGSLALFLVDDTSREMMLRLISSGESPSLIDVMLESLSKLEGEGDEQALVSSILRFLCEWMIGASPVVQAILSSTQSTVLGVLAASVNKVASTMTILLLGIAIEFMGDEEKCGGWTRQSLMEIIGKRKGGVSATATSLEQFKSHKTGLSWAECALEWQVWSTWYSNQVLVVRRRIVQELTGGTEQDDEDGSDDNVLLVSGDSKSKVKSLQSLVSQQSLELDELRQSLSSALATIDSQKQELEVWKRRAESTPMQVDDILNEYTTKNADLEKIVETLKSDRELQQRQFHDQLQEKDKRIAFVQSELVEWQQREQQACEERDSIREEMEALSGAYNSLEEEYRRATSSSTIRTATAAPTGERGDDERSTAEQPEGEVSEQTPFTGGSTEVSTLRADNARIRSNLEAAEEWMEMAVQRMNGFLSQIAGLENDLEATRTELAQARSDQSSQESEVAQQLRAEQEGSRQLREQLEAIVSHIHSLAGDEQEGLSSQQPQQRNLLSAIGELDKLQSIKQELTNALDDTASKLSALREDANRERSEYNALLEAERQKISSIEESFAQRSLEWQTLVDAKEEEMRVLRQQIEELSHSVQESSGAIAKAQELAEIVKSLEKQLEAAHNDAAAVKEREQAEIYKRESTIRELQAKLGQSQGRFTIDDIETRDEEIAQLREANAAAQDWMAKAVEQHQILSEKLVAFGEENASLSRQLQEAKSKVYSLENDSNKIQELERRSRELDESVAQLKTTQSTLSSREQQIARLEAELDGVRVQLQKLKWAEEEVARANEQVIVLRRELEASEQSRENSIHSLESEVEARKSQVVQLESEITRMMSERSEMVPTDTRLEELENDISSLQKTLREATESERLLRREVETNRLEVDKKTAELAAAVSDAEKHYHQTVILTEMVEKLEAERSKFDRQEDSPQIDSKSLAVRVLELEQAAYESQQLLAQLQEAKADLRRDEDIVHQWEERVAELEANVSDLEKQLLDQETEASNVISLWQDRCATFEQEMSVLKDEAVQFAQVQDRVSLLEITLRDQEKEANDVISQWQSRCEAFEKENLKMQEEINSSVSFRERVAELELSIGVLVKQVSEKENEIEQVNARWQETCETLESENSALRASAEAGTKAQERLASLETVVDSLERQVVEAEKEKSLSMSEWQSRFEEHEQQIMELKKQVESLEATRDDLIKQVAEGNIAIAQLREKCAALEEEKAELGVGAKAAAGLQMRIEEYETSYLALQNQLAEQEQDAHNVVLQWEETCTLLETESMQLKRDIADMSDRIAALEATEIELRSQLTEQINEANLAIAQWDQTCKTYEHENAKLKEEMARIYSSEQHTSEILRKLEDQLEEQENEANAALSQWEERCSAYEQEIERLKAESAEKHTAAALRELEDQLEEQENEANAALSQWEERCLAYEQEVTRLKAETAEKPKEIKEQEEEANVSISQLEQKCSAYEQEVTRLKAEIAEVQAQLCSASHETSAKELEKQQLTDKANMMGTAISELQERCLTLDTENAMLRDQLSAATSTKEELVLANNVLKSELEGHDRKHEMVLTELESRVGSLESKCKSLERDLHDSREDKEALLKGVERVKAAFDEKSRKIEDMEKQFAQTLEKLLAEKEALRSELESELSAKQEAEALLHEIAQLKDSVASLQERSVAAEQYAAELKLDLEAERDNALQSLKTAEETIAKDSERLGSLLYELRDKDTLIERMTSELANKTRAHEKSTGNYAEKDAAISSAFEEIATLKAEIEAINAESEDAITQWKDRVAELEGLNQDLEDQLDQASSAANDAISCWEMRYEELSMTMADIERSGRESLEKVVNLVVLDLQFKDALLEMLGKQPQTRDPLPETIRSESCTTEDVDNFVTKASAAIKSLSDSVMQAIELDRTRRLSLESNQVPSKMQPDTIQAVQSLEDRIRQLEDVVTQKDIAIATLEKEASEDKKKLQELEDACGKAMNQVEIEKRNRIDASAVCEALQAVHNQEKASMESAETASRKDLERKLEEQKRKIEKLEQEVSDYQCRADMLQIERVRIEDALTKEKILENEQIETWRQEYEFLKKEVEEERGKWNSIVSQLEEDLRQANDTLQTMYTDEVSMRATAAVAEALRNQVEEMQAKLQGKQNELVQEAAARRIAEKEAAQLKSDLAILLAMDGNDDVDMIAFKASDRIQRKERDEIEELRKTLARSQQELSSSRAASIDAEDKAAKARLQASICEQELISTKADLKFLAQSMEDMREGEETRRAALEYRINALEDDHEVLRRFHADEVDTLRNELTQVSMEKDRVLHKLKESEKALSALMFASSQGTDKDGGISSPKSELMKLKIEREQMLYAAEEEASNVEKRIREAIGAHASSLEADVILERDLRIAAEAALENTRKEIAELRSTIDHSPSKGSTSPASVANKLKSELERCTHDNQKLTEENASLRAELDRINAETKVMVNKLTEQCRKAQIKAHKLESDNRLESDVKNEVTRLRKEERDDDITLWHSNANGHNPADDLDSDHPAPPSGGGGSSSKAFDLIQQQKEAIQEERQLYLELLAEHEDLLALVAQQDLERESLQQALLKAGGREAVEEATRTAEEKALAQFGKHVKLSQA